MGAPNLALLLIFGGPLACALAPRFGAGLLLVLAASSAVIDGVQPAFAAAVVGGGSGALIAVFARGPRSRAACVTVWLGACLAPVWLPALGQRLAGEAPGLAAWTWHLWPGSVLAGENWDPIRASPLYASWNDVPTPAGSWLLWGLAIVVLAGSLYSARARRTEGAPEP